MNICNKSIIFQQNIPINDKLPFVNKEIESAHKLLTALDIIKDAKEGDHTLSRPKSEYVKNINYGINELTDKPNFVAQKLSIDSLEKDYLPHKKFAEEQIYEKQMTDNFGIYQIYLYFSTNPEKQSSQDEINSLKKLNFEYAFIDAYFASDKLHYYNENTTTTTVETPGHFLDPASRSQLGQHNIEPKEFTSLNLNQIGFKDIDIHTEFDTDTYSVCIKKKKDDDTYSEICSFKINREAKFNDPINPSFISKDIIGNANKNNKLETVDNNEAFIYILLKELGDTLQAAYMHYLVYSDKFSSYTNMNTCLFTHDHPLAIRARLLGLPICFKNSSKSISQPLDTEKKQKLTHKLATTFTYYRPQTDPIEQQKYLNNSLIKELIKKNGEQVQLLTELINTKYNNALNLKLSYSKILLETIIDIINQVNAFFEWLKTNETMLITIDAKEFREKILQVQPLIDSEKNLSTHTQSLFRFNKSNDRANLQEILTRLTYDNLNKIKISQFNILPSEDFDSIIEKVIIGKNLVFMLTFPHPNTIIGFKNILDYFDKLCMFYLKRPNTEISQSGRSPRFRELQELTVKILTIREALYKYTPDQLSNFYNSCIENYVDINKYDPNSKSIDKMQELYNNLYTIYTNIVAGNVNIFDVSHTGGGLSKKNIRSRQNFDVNSIYTILLSYFEYIGDIIFVDEFFNEVITRILSSTILTMDAFNKLYNIYKKNKKYPDNYINLILPYENKIKNDADLVYYNSKILKDQILKLISVIKIQKKVRQNITKKLHISRKSPTIRKASSTRITNRRPNRRISRRRTRRRTGRIQLVRVTKDAKGKQKNKNKSDRNCKTKNQKKTKKQLIKNR